MRALWLTDICAKTPFGTCMRSRKLGLRKRRCLLRRLANTRPRLVVLLGALELRQLSPCCGMPFCPLLCTCAWGALPWSWAPITNIGKPRKCVQITTASDAHTTAALPVTVGRAAVGTVVTPVLEANMSAVSCGQMETGSTS